MAETLRISVSLPSSNDLYALRGKNDWDAAAGYERFSGESRGFLVNNGTGRPSAVELDPASEGPLTYDVRPEITIRDEETKRTVSEAAFAVISKENATGKEDKALFRCRDIPGRGPVIIADKAIAQITLNELPDGVPVTMETIGADKPLQGFADEYTNAYIDIYDSACNRLTSAQVIVDYDRDACLEPDYTAPVFSVDIRPDLVQGIETGNMDSTEEIDETYEEGIG